MSPRVAVRSKGASHRRHEPAGHRGVAAGERCDVVAAREQLIDQRGHDPLRATVAVRRHGFRGGGDLSNPEASSHGWGPRCNAATIHRPPDPGPEPPVRARPGRSCRGRCRARGSPSRAFVSSAPQRPGATSVAAAMCGGSISKSGAGPRACRCGRSRRCRARRVRRHPARRSCRAAP